MGVRIYRNKMQFGPTSAIVSFNQSRGEMSAKIKYYKPLSTRLVNKEKLSLEV